MINYLINELNNSFDCKYYNFKELNFKIMHKANEINNKIKKNYLDSILSYEVRIWHTYEDLEYGEYDNLDYTNYTDAIKEAYELISCEKCVHAEVYIIITTNFAIDPVKNTKIKINKKDEKFLCCCKLDDDE